jgi:hypothetical protein
VPAFRCRQVITLDMIGNRVLILDPQLIGFFQNVFQAQLINQPPISFMSIHMLHLNTGNSFVLGNRRMNSWQLSPPAHTCG